MSGRKRKATADPNRRVKVRRRDMEEAETWEPPFEGEDEDEHGRERPSDDDSEQEQEQDKDSDSKADEPEAKKSKDEAGLSFGARLRLSQKRQNHGTKSKSKSTTTSTQHAAAIATDDDKDGTSSSRFRPPPAADADKPPAAARKRKGAPEEMSSRRPVSRFREVVKRPANARPRPRDVRFDRELSEADQRRFRRDYAFLDQYRDAELARLREVAAAASTAKGVTAEDREDARRRVAVMEDERRAQHRKDRERELLDEHKRKERELVRQGKKPFFLKRSEQKKLLLMDKFAGMSKGQVDKAIERKRKKVAGKEKKQLPYERRGVE